MESDFLMMKLLIVLSSLYLWQYSPHAFLCHATFNEDKYPGDEVPDFNLATADGIKPWKERKHIGSPTSILFFTKEQQQLWNEKRVLLMSDY